MSTSQIDQSDTQVNYQKLEDGDFDLGSAGWIADYNDPSNFLDVLRTGGGNNYGRYANPKFDALLDQAAAERDLAKRGQILAQAEQMMLDEYPRRVRALPDPAGDRPTLCEGLGSEQQTAQPDALADGREVVSGRAQVI